jgi:hypothetical protein
MFSTVLLYGFFHYNLARAKSVNSARCSGDYQISGETMASGFNHVISKDS